MCDFAAMQTCPARIKSARLGATTHLTRIAQPLELFARPLNAARTGGGLFSHRAYLVLPAPALSRRIRRHEPPVLPAPAALPSLRTRSAKTSRSPAGAAIRAETRFFAPSSFAMNSLRSFGTMKRSGRRVRDARIRAPARSPCLSQTAIHPAAERQAARLLLSHAGVDGGCEETDIARPDTTRPVRFAGRAR